MSVVLAEEDRAELSDAAMQYIEHLEAKIEYMERRIQDVIIDSVALHERIEQLTLGQILD